MRSRLSLLVAPAFLAGCLPHPPPPAAPYHALGKDSGWHLVIDDKHVTFIPPGRQPIREPKPQVIVGVAGEIYRTARIDVNIVHGSCTVGDRAFPDRVQVSVDGTQHEGCGGL
ncbi:MAG TPA: hypothetical protein VFU80_03055 [Sphingomicrobium sp.]|nr:hypothetical protein [Sphingomicrobium sp.]